MSALRHSVIAAACAGVGHGTITKTRMSLSAANVKTTFVAANADAQVATMMHTGLSWPPHPCSRPRVCRCSDGVRTEGISLKSVE